MSGLDAPVAVSDDQVAAFERDGFARQAGLLAAVDLEPFAEVIDEVTSASKQAQVPLEERTTYARAFIQEGNVWQRRAGIRALTFSPRLAEAAARLMGVRGVRLYHDQALVKEAGGGHTPWHCDQHYWPLGTDRTVTAWIPLVDVPLEAGPLRFSVGSHRIDLGRDVEIGDRSDQHVRRHPRWRELEVDEHAASLGDVTFHQGWTFHGAGPNESDGPRLVHTVIYMDADMTLAQPRTDAQRFDQQVWLPDSEVGAPVDSWLNPIVWHEDGSHAATLDALPGPTRAIGTIDLGRPRTG